MDLANLFSLHGPCSLFHAPPPSASLTPTEELAFFPVRCNFWLILHECWWNNAVGMFVSIVYMNVCVSSYMLLVCSYFDRGLLLGFLLGWTSCLHLGIQLSRLSSVIYTSFLASRPCFLSLNRSTISYLIDLVVLSFSPNLAIVIWTCKSTTLATNATVSLLFQEFSSEILLGI